MNTYADRKQENKSQSIANTVAQKKGETTSIFQFVDNRPNAVAQRKLQNIANNSHLKKENKNSSLVNTSIQQKALTSTKGQNSNIIQKYSYKAVPAEITAQLPTGTQKWTESTGAKVTWKKGETMDPNSIGSHKVNNHGWVGLLKNQSNGNNATGLHVVNANWGGSANALDGNLVPGTPSLNGHHKTIENKVHSQFSTNSGKAPEDMSYEADVWTPYPQTMDLTKNKSGDEIPYKDAIIKCTVKVGTGTIVNNEAVELGGGTKIVIP